MPVDTGRIVAALKGMADKNGPDFLTDEPHKVFEELVETGVADRRSAGAILYFLVVGMAEKINDDCSFDEFSKDVQRSCSFNKRMADMLTTIFLSLYTLSNREAWRAMEQQGLEQFKREKHSLEWNGMATWDAGTVSIDCYFHAEIELKPTASLVVGSELAAILKKNPYTSKEDIWMFYRGLLSRHLDHEFDWYCTCEKYYEPVVEDFEIEYCVKKWCKDNGFEVISCKGEGDDSGYITDDVRRYLRYD